MIPLGKTNYRGMQRTFGIEPEDLAVHVWVLGGSGTGKSTLLTSMMAAHAERGEGFGFLDPHGWHVPDILDRIPAFRAYHTVYFNPHDPHPLSLNPIDTAIDIDLRVSNIVSLFLRIWGEELIGPMTQQLLRHSVYALCENPGASLLWIPRMLLDAEFRGQILQHVTRPVTKQFWERDFNRRTKRDQAEITSPIKNKLDALLSFGCMQASLAQEKRTVDIKKIMDDGQIFFADLSKGTIGEQNMQVIGSLIASEFFLTALTRRPGSKPFPLYIDECANVKGVLKDILSEARKFGLSVVVAHQYLRQLDADTLDALSTNAGTKIVFRTAQPQDAEYFAQEFAPATASDFMNLPNHEAYIRLFHQGQTSSAFSMMTDPLKPPIGAGAMIIEESRRRFGFDRKKLDAKIQKFLG